MTESNAIRGRSEIAAALGRSEKTISRWHALGILPTRKAGPFENSPLVVRAEDVARLREQFGEAE
ncbi:MAG: hypothetical protein AB7F37_08905 [Variibacter sp.]